MGGRTWHETMIYGELSSRIRLTFSFLRHQIRCSKRNDWCLIDMNFSLYVLFSQFRPRDVLHRIYHLSFHKLYVHNYLPGVMKIGLAKFCNFSQLRLSNSLTYVYCFACLCVFFFLPVFWLGICVEVDVDRITILPPPPPSLLIFFPCPQLFL